MASRALTRAKQWTTATLAATTVAVGALTYHLAASYPAAVADRVVVAQPTPAAQPRATVAPAQEPAQTQTKGS